MKIGIIGTGNIGTTLIRKLAKAGHNIQMANSRGAETLTELAEETGAKALSAQEAIQDVDVIILSIPLNKLPDMKEVLAELPDDVIVADTSNYYPMRDGQIEALDNGQVESEWVSEQVGKPIIKVWNNVLAATLADKGQPAVAEGRIALSVAGNDSTAKKVIMSLVEDTGFDAIDGGSIAESWRQQPGTPGYCADQTIGELQSALQAADKSRAPQVRDAIMKEISALGDDFTHEDILRLNRKLSV